MMKSNLVVCTRTLLFACFLLSLQAFASAESEEVILGNAQETPAEQNIKLTTHVAELNRYTFAGNALRASGGGPETWVVSFCPHWWKPCQKLEHMFEQSAFKWQSKLNDGDFGLRVRFGKVDCAVDKVLCNEQRVYSYPTLAVYQSGRRKAKLALNGKAADAQLKDWLEKNLQTAEPDAMEASLQATAPGVHFHFGQSSVDLILALIAIAASIRLVGRNPDLWQPSKASKASACDNTRSLPAASNTRVRIEL